MRQLFYTPGGSLTVRDVPPPTLTDGAVLVANVCSVISTGTERDTVRLGTESLWRKALRRPQLVGQFIEKTRREGLGTALGKVREKTAELKPLGYACAGRILSVGRRVTDLAPGQSVACAGADYAHHAEIVAVPCNLVAPIPPGVDFEAAAFTTLGAIAMQGLRRAELAFGETVVVLGLGLLGLLAVQIARAAGYRVVGVDIDDERIALARQLGAGAALNSTTQDIPAQLHAMTDGFGADAVVIYAATPSSEPVNMAFDLCRQRGRVVAVGAFGMDLDRERMYRKELDFVMSTSYGPGRYDSLYEEQGVDYPIGHVRWTENRNMQAFLQLLASNQVDVRPMVSRRFPIERAPEAYALLEGEGADVDHTSADNAIPIAHRAPETTPLESDARPLALVLTYEPVSEPLPTDVKQPTTRVQIPVPDNQPIGVAIVGAGSFVRSVHLPALRDQSPDYRIAAIVTAHGEKAAAIARQYDAPLATTDYRQALAAPGTHLALIGTRHHLHAPMVLDALAAGLPVLCEKPLCLTPDQLEEIRAAVVETGLPVWVGFNRRYSPLSIVLKQALHDPEHTHATVADAGEAAPPHGARPALITYRVNAGFLPADHWTQVPDVGGGRLVGEGCHFFDFFHFLLDRPGAPVTPVDVSASLIPPGEGAAARDNFIVTTRFDDGSVASLIYTALGHPALAKERIEVHTAGVSLILDDFVLLQAHGAALHSQTAPFRWRALPGASRGNSIRLRKQDKGIAQQWREIARALRGHPSQAIPFDAVHRAMTLTFRAEAALRGEL